MWTTYLTGAGALALLLAGWLVVQRAWQRTVPAPGGDPDALSGRTGCAGRACERPCEHRCTAPPGAGEEESA